MGIEDKVRRDDDSEEPTSVLYFDLDKKRTEAVVEHLEAEGYDVAAVSSVDGTQWLSVLELVQYDAVVLEAQGEGIAVARRLVTELIGPQGTTVIPTILLVSPEHTLPFSAAVDLPMVELPFEPTELCRIIDSMVGPVPGTASGRYRRQMATVSLADIAIRPTASLKIIPRRTLPGVSRGRSRARRSLPWIAAGVAAAAAVVALVGSSTASEAPTNIQAAPVAQTLPALPRTAEPIAAAMTPALWDKVECPKGTVFIEGRTFPMGTDDDNPALTTAQPAHSVTVEGFCIDRTEVTVDAYRECSGSGECDPAHRDSWWPQGQQERAAWERSLEIHGQLCNERYDDRGQHPINCVTWAQADAYCEWKGMSLPTEAQWELAARGADGRHYPWGDAEPNSETLNGCGAECRAWRREAQLDSTDVLYDQDDGFEGTAPVGSFPAGNSAAGVADLAGNVFEWTADPFVAYEGSSKAEPDRSERRVIRGGAFNSFRAEFADPALRFDQEVDAHSHGIGFRCVTTPR